VGRSPQVIREVTATLPFWTRSTAVTERLRPRFITRLATVASPGMVGPTKWLVIERGSGWGTSCPAATRHNAIRYPPLGMPLMFHRGLTRAVHSPAPTWFSASRVSASKR